MIKDYNKWMPVKSEIHNSELRPMGFKERDIWICNLGDNIGFEEDGKGVDFTRPVLILKVFSREFCYIVPLSTTDNRGNFYYPFDGKTGKVSVALLSQMRAIDSARLRNKIGVVNKTDFGELKKQVIQLIL